VVSGTDGETLLRWIPLVPLLAALLHGVMIGVVRRSTPRWAVIVISCGAALLSFIFSCVAFFNLVQLPPEGRVLVDSIYTWIGAGVS
jgi:NADH:ubiquinone oxidoreductase subunit 5 (subunit L)/multisubunit Na+/H+ antiporter MnhA subunit